MDFKVILQVFTGGFLGKTVSWETVEKKLRSVLPLLPVRALVMGWAFDRSLYEKTASFLAERNIDFYLWFPVFSETGSLRELDPLVGYNGGNVEFPGGGEENFSFCCPNQDANITRILDIYETEFASIPFKGVFLDKIRYPSFAQAGLEGVLTCFCPECLKQYKKSLFDAEQLPHLLSCSKKAPLGIHGYLGKGRYLFEDKNINEFFIVKSALITRGIKRLCDYFRVKGLSIGLDVFAPFLSLFVGQNLQELSKLCDFMKPMMYRATNAPAGLPFETEMLLRETAGGDDHKRYLFYKALGLDPEKKPFDLNFAAGDLEKLTAVSSCPIYAGVEINRKPNIAEVYPAYIRETLTAYAGTGIKGFALSWDLLNAPRENILKAARVLEKL